MKITLCVDINGQFYHGRSARQIPELVRQCFEPLKTCDDPTLAYVTGETLAGSQEAAIVIQTREDAAEILAKELAEMIVSAMKKNDTHNGYSDAETKEM